jgi:hypothetical protein
MNGIKTQLTVHFGFQESSIEVEVAFQANDKAGGNQQKRNDR